MRKAPVLSDWLILANASDYLGLGTLETPAEGPQYWQMQSGDRLAYEEVKYWSHLTSPQWQSAKAPEPESLLDEDGYPTPRALYEIENWHWGDPLGWFRFIERLWYLKSLGWGGTETGGTSVKFSMSTAGWSGNESLIRAMRKNHMLWSSCWTSSRAGGHYEFEIKD
jgi:hypothetical protein